MAAQSVRLAEKATLAGLNLKRCSKCLVIYPLSADYFYRSKRYRDGLFSQCRTCMDASVKAWFRRRFQADPDFRERIRERDRQKYHRRKFSPALREKHRQADERRKIKRLQMISSESPRLPFAHENPSTTKQVVAFMALHYGLDYIQYAIRSVIDYVDRLYVAYSPEGSHGTRGSEACPESGAQLIRAAREAAGDKLVWYEGKWANEAAQRNSIYDAAPNADLILTLDSDEIWRSDMVARVLSAAWEGDVRNYLVRGIHFWRSFWRAATDDFAAPTRVVNTRRESGSRELNAYFAHMGYAIRPDLMRYKWTIHGHIHEQRKDLDWYRDVFLKNKLTDCHPTNVHYWNTVAVDPLAWMPSFMAEHAWFGNEVIE